MAGWLDVGGLSFAENRATWPGASRLEEQEDDDGSGDVALVGDTWQSSCSAAAPLSLARSARCFKCTSFTCREMKGEE